VQHPGLAAVLDVGEQDIADETVVWIIMALAPGSSLAEVVASPGLDLAAALVITSRVLDALSAVHAAGLVHRDLSPGNVMVELTGGADAAQQVGAVTVLDLGLAGAAGLPVVGASPDRPAGPEAGSQQLVTGTPRYMSPEQARGLTVDARGDVYAVGALLYLMLTGHAPYERSDPAAVLRAHVQAPVPVPSARADVPHAVDRLVSRAMAKSPARRFASAAEMRAAVDEALADVLRAGIGPSSAAGTRVLPAASSSAARTTRIAPTSAAAAGALVRFDSNDLRSRQGVPSGAASSGASAGAGSGAASGAVSGAGPRAVSGAGPRAVSGAGSGAGPRATSGRALPGAGEPWRPPAEPPVPRWSGAAILLICVLAGVGWLAVQGESASNALTGDSPTLASASPSASASSTPTDPVSSTPAPQTVAPTVSMPAALPEIVPRVAVPPLASLGLPQARTSLEGAGLVLGKVSSQDSAEPAGTVLESDPATGQPVLPGSSIRLTVASGRNVVPSVRGLELAQAIAAVESMGLVPLPVATPDASVPPGYAIGANPATGARLLVGSAVTLMVSDGPAAGGPDPVPPSTAPPVPLP
jgi:serine/threonine-protein kinase